ncbi:MAG TPA: VWA domain-containing protein [Planctomycetota bacterium]|nr:VWA domain-containing protein [Planctomycetota bacterium]
MIQVALYEYGKASIPAAEQHLRQVLPFTTDLDRVSEQLFALTTNGGEEYCGAVIRAASRGLSWSTRTSDLKVMIVAGNEPFTQGMVDYRLAVIEAANGQGILINTIFCGQRGEGIASGWQDGAQLASGTFSAIDQERAVAVIPAPQDDELARLGLEINRTYIAYGYAGKEGADRQVMQDANSSSLSSSNFASRACAKASLSYCNEHWDLVDAVEQKAVNMAAMALADLPEGMRSMTPEQRVAYVAGKLAERRKIQERIQQLAQEREKFLAAKRTVDAPALDDAIIASVRDQAKRRGFAFP